MGIRGHKAFHQTLSGLMIAIKVIRIVTGKISLFLLKWLILGCHKLQTFISSKLKENDNATTSDKGAGETKQSS